MEILEHTKNNETVIIDGVTIIGNSASASDDALGCQ